MMQKTRKVHRQFGDIFGRVSRADLSSWFAFKSSPLIGWLSFILLCVAITFLMTFSVSDIPEDIIAGTIAQRDIRADRNYEIVDQEATNNSINDAVAAVLNVYDHNNNAGKEIAESISEAFEDMRDKLALGEGKALQTDLSSFLNASITDDEWDFLISNNFNKQIEQAIEAQIEAAMAKLIALDIESIVADKAKGIMVRDSSGNERIFGAKEFAGISSLDDIRKKVAEGRFLSKKRDDLTSQLAAKLIRPNLNFNLTETERQRRAAKENAKVSFEKVEAGELIINGGDRYDRKDIMILEGIRQEKKRTTAPFKVAGTFLLVALVMLTVYYFAEKYIKKFAPGRAGLYFMGSLLILILIILRICIGISMAVHDSIGFEIPLTAFYYAIPVGGAAMLARFILNSETALVFSIVSSIFAGVFVGHSLNYTAYCMISSIAAAASIAYADKRSAIIKAGLYTAAVNVFAAAGIQMVSATSLAEPLTFINMVWYILFAILGGISCAVIVSLITPLAESVFGYTTDIKLLELANLNHPLLRELVIRAPGTYHHSHLVGILAEAAAEAIGANPLLARVAAYYHDIGKIRKPLYFVENTSDCESRHDKLSPHMSALIISSHVKDGADLAAQYKIPKKIADMIPEHHGTKMISFFYDRAKKEADPALGVPDEKDFRYQGPKPQTRESGLLLLADSVEATVRSLKEKSPSRIQQTVEDVINSSFTEAQLDECDLTLRNLHDIGSSFTKILMGIYHQRIEYPKETLSGNEKSV